MVFVVFVALALVLAGLLVYNVGTANLARTKLQNTADSAAYSDAVLLARTFNFASYTNRAMVANHVAIAQMVSLASWSRYYCHTFGTKCGKFPATGTSTTMNAALKLFEPGQPGGATLKLYRPYSKAIFKVMDKTLPLIVTGLNLLEKAQSLASITYFNSTMLELFPLSEKFVEANDPDATLGSVGETRLAASALKIKTGFAKTYNPQLGTSYKKKQKNRFRKVTLGSLDKWTKRRVGPEIPPFTSLLWSAGNCFGDGFGFFIETGAWTGTTKFKPDNATWNANDKGIFVGAGVCVIIIYVPVPIPIPIPVIVPNPPPLGRACTGNGTGCVKKNRVGKYDGLQKYLGVKKLKKNNYSSPKIVLYVQRDKGDIDTTDATNQVGGRLNVEDKEASGVMRVAAAANAYFRRPDGDRKYGSKWVLGNFFNPYWEPHLVPVSDTELTVADLAQGSP